MKPCTAGSSHSRPGAAHWGGSGNLFWEPLYLAMRGMQAARAGSLWACVPFRGLFGSRALCAASAYVGPNLKVSKYSPADIVSQLFPLDNSGLDSNPSPRGCGAFIAFLLPTPGFQTLPLCSLRERRKDKEGRGRQEGRAAVGVGGSFASHNNRPPPSGQRLLLGLGVFFQFQNSLIQVLPFCINYMDQLVGWVVHRVQDGGGEAATSCFL